MAIRENLCTPLDVRNLSEFITSQVRDNARIVQFIQREDAVIRAALKSVYPDGDAALLYADGPWNGPVQLPFPHENELTGQTVQNSGTGTLWDITPSSTAVTELWTITFSSATAYSVQGSYSGSEGTGSTDADYDNGSIAIPAANWSGTPAINDQFFVCTYRWDPLIVALSAKRAAALAVTSVFDGLSEGMAEEGRRLRRESKELLEALQKPNSDTGLRLGTFTARDISPEGIAYFVDAYGQDVSQYVDNARTPWNDAYSGGSGMGFLYGRMW